MARPANGIGFWDRVWGNAEVLENGCVVFNGNKDDCGYGRISRDGKLVRIHREVYKHLNPDEEITGVIMHSCDNPACINWEHLSHGTQADNVADMVAKGRRVTVKGMAQADAKLADNDIRDIRFLLKKKMSHHIIAGHYKVSEATIRFISIGKTWKHIEGISASVPFFDELLYKQICSPSITEADIPNIRKQIVDGMRCSEIARQYNVTGKTIRLIKNRKTWTHVK